MGRNTKKWGKEKSKVRKRIKKKYGKTTYKRKKQSQKKDQARSKTQNQIWNTYQQKILQKAKGWTRKVKESFEIVIIIITFIQCLHIKN